MPDVISMYRSIVDEACERAVALECEGFVAELETLLEMTLNPQYAIDLTTTINEVFDKYYEQYGLKTALRVTPNDTREMMRPPLMRKGELLEKMLETFEGTAAAGGEALSIESTGGKELHDNALLTCDITQVIFALGIMGCRDMEFLWGHICRIAKKYNTFAGGDSACGFGNTAMVLAEKKMIPRVFAAVVRGITTVRSLVAYEQGAIGPGKDCAYENIYLKAITGFPMSMEGKIASCAHLSPVGNVAMATCDIWSNESIQNIKLLGGMAPTVCFEQLAYDCRLMNTATDKHHEMILRDLLVDSDAQIDPQAFVLSPDAAIKIAKAVVGEKNHYRASVVAGLTTVNMIKEAVEQGKVKVSDMELPYLDIIGDTLSSLPCDEQQFIADTLPMTDKEKYQPGEYGL
jgi:methanol--5-hydroxybenzimidazolylcobamide Co-methyltransferase